MGVSFVAPHAGESPSGGITLVCAFSRRPDTQLRSPAVSSRGIRKPGGSMRISTFVSIAATAVVPAAAFAAETQGGHGKPEPPMAGIHWAKDVQPAAKRGGGSPNLTWHGGNIMDSAVVATIFWGPSWQNKDFASDKMSGLDTFYLGLIGSGYAHTNTEYKDGDTFVGTTVTFESSYVDINPVTKGAGTRTGPVLDEVCKVIPDPVANGYYAVYIDQPRGRAGYCAWHSAGTCGTTPVQFAFFFNLDGDAGCDPQDSSGLHSQGLSALANVSGHEWSEMMTDPRLDAWYDSSGAENSDKCACAFGSPLITLANQSQWKIQGNWSNAAYDAGDGYPNRDGLRGCIDGGVFP
jgi:hypothetical protein